MIQWIKENIYCNHPDDAIVGECNETEQWIGCTNCMQSPGNEHWFWKRALVWFYIQYKKVQYRFSKDLEF